MKKNIIIPAALCVALSLFACDRCDRETDKAIPAEIEWTPLEAHEKYTATELVEAYPDDSLGYTFEADYTLLTPKTKDGSEYPFLDIVARELMSRLDTLSTDKQEAPEVLLEQFVSGQLDSYKAMMKELAPQVSQNKYNSAYIETHTMKDSLVFDQKGLVSILSEWTAYNGGAHGSYGHIGKNFDFNKETVLTDKALFIDGSESEINALILGKLMKDLGASDVQVLRDSLGIHVDGVAMNDNFYFGEKGITYIYNPYEIASYAQGEIFVHLPYADLVPYLREEYASLAE